MKRIITVFVCIIVMAGILSSACISSQALEYDEPLRYGGTTISGNTKHVYDRLVAAFSSEDTPEKILFDAENHVSQTELNVGLELFLCDYPEYFWVDRTSEGWTEETSTEDGSIISLSPVYSFTGNDLTKAKKALLDAVEDILEDMPDGNTYDRAHYLHDELAGEVKYVKEGLHQTAYGALVNGKAVCAGYASAYQLLCHAAGIDCWRINGTSRDIAHAWNLVWMDEDTCVYTDVTWDDLGEDGLSHYYLNLSKSEIDEGHTPESIFALPECDHDGESYFDVNGLNLTDSTTAKELAAMFGAANNNKRSANVCYLGNDLTALLTGDYLSSLYYELGGQYSNNTGYRVDAINGNEIRMTLWGSFTPTYTVELIGPTMTASALRKQTVVQGQPISDIIFTANNGYYFPEYYEIDPTGGLTFTRVSSSHIKVSGTPTGSMQLTLPAPTPMSAEATPTAVFTATGADTGVLSGVNSGMQYSTNGLVWTDIASDEDITLSGISPETDILVRTKGNGETTVDSAVQTIDVTRPATPELTASSPDAEDKKGSINTDSTHEYSKDGVTWTDCAGALGELDAGTYYVRVKASGTALASEAQTLTVNAYVPPVEETPEPEEEETPTPPENNDTENDDATSEEDEDTATEGDEVTEDEGKADAETPNETDAPKDTEPQASETESAEPEATEPEISETLKDSVDVNVNVGCGGTVGGAAVAVIIAALGAGITIKKREE